MKLVVVERRFSRFVKYGPLRLSFSRFDLATESTVLRVAYRGGAALYRVAEYGLKLCGFCVGSPRPENVIGFITIDTMDLMMIECDLLPPVKVV